MFSFFKISMKGDLGTKRKNIGKTLPPFPNGWFVACTTAELNPNSSKAIDISGRNITVFRSKSGTVFALHSYCAHLGANFGEGGVVDGQCIQCPFHGWLYDGQTGLCVGNYQNYFFHDGKAVKARSMEYQKDFGTKDCKQVDWKVGQPEQIKLRKYLVCEINGYVYVWIDADENAQPKFKLIDLHQQKAHFQGRRKCKHFINCHIQDIAQNAADVFHFKYFHRYVLAKLKLFQIVWKPHWAAGDDPAFVEVFEHKQKSIHEFKQKLLAEIQRQDLNLEHYGFATVDMYLKVPLIGPVLVLKITIIQIGSGKCTYC